MRLIIPLLLLLAACERNDNAPDVGGVTAGEARALNEAAEMLDNESATAAPSNER